MAQAQQILRHSDNHDDNNRQAERKGNMQFSLKLKCAMPALLLQIHVYHAYLPRTSPYFLHPSYHVTTVRTIYHCTNLHPSYCPPACKFTMPPAPSDVTIIRQFIMPALLWLAKRKVRKLRGCTRDSVMLKDNTTRRFTSGASS